MARNGFRNMPTSMRGVQIDMDAMRAANDTSVAIGNARMNARGDVLGPNGQIEVRREMIARDYLARNPQAATQVSLKPAMPDQFDTPEEAVARLTGLVDETDAPVGLAKRPRRLVDRSDD